MAAELIMKMKRAGRLLFHDIWSIRIPVICFMIYWVITRLLFGHYCPLVILTGLPCPGCGMTRAMQHLLLLEFDEAWRYNPAIYAWLLWGVQAVWRRYIKGEEKMNQTAVLTVVLAVTVVCYFWRMKTVFPFTPPMKYEWDNIFAKELPFYQKIIKRLFF